MSEVVPNGWSMVEFESFTTLQRGKDLTRAQFREGNVPVAGSNGLIGYHDTAIAKAPGITVGRSGSAGKVTVYEEDFWPHNTSLYVRDFHGNDPHFAGFLLGSLNLARFKTGASVPTLDRNSFKTLPILVPPLPEQKKIAHILSAVQRAIEAQERIILTTTELKKALMHKLFTEGLRNEPKKQTEIGAVPESWVVVEFDKFATLQRGYDLRKQDFREGEVPVIGATQVIGYHDTANVKAPGVTVVRSGSSAGKPLFISDDFWAHNVLLYVKDFHCNVPKFVYYKILDLDLTQYRQGVAVPTLNRNTFSAIELALPSPDEQQEIADVLDSVGNRTVIAENKKAQLKDLFRTLLHELMTVKLRVDKLEITGMETSV
jgi:type I restriction enzyme S subunit